MKWQSKTRCISGSLWECKYTRPATKKKRRRGGLKPYIPHMHVWNAVIVIPPYNPWTGEHKFLVYEDEA